MEQKEQPMFTLCGEVKRVYVQPGGVSKKTGEVYDPKDKVQILGDIPLPEGGHKLDLVTLNVENGKVYEALLGKVIRVPVGFYALNRSVGYFIPKGGIPVLARRES